MRRWFAVVLIPFCSSFLVADDGPELFGPRLVQPDVTEVETDETPIAPAAPLDEGLTEPTRREIVPPTPIDGLPTRPVIRTPNSPVPIDGPRRALQTVPAPQPQPPVPHETRRVTTTEPALAPLRIEVGESFANRWLSRQSTKEAPVQDVILEANVQGWQRTTTNVTVDFLPCATGGRFDFRAVGETNSDTLGLTEKATLRTLGQHRFQGTKPVLLHGDRFLVKQATIYVQPSNTTVGMWTKYDGLPLIGPIAMRTAARKSEEARPAAEKIAADRVAERVLPEFDGEVNGRLNRVNALIAERRERYVENDLWPTRTAATSTDTSLVVDAWYGEAAALGAIPRTGVLRNDDVSLALHESLLAEFVDRANVGGMVSTKDDITEFFRSLPEWVEVRKPEPAEEDEAGSMASLVKFVLDEDRPARIEFADDLAYVTLRVRIRPAIGNDLPAQDVRLAVKGTLGEEGIVFTTESVDVTRVDGEEDAASRAMGKLLADRLQADLPTLVIPRYFAIPASTANGVGSLRVTELAARDGWLLLRAK